MNQIKSALAPKDGEFGIAFEWADAQVGRDLDVLTPDLCPYVCVLYAVEHSEGL